MRKILYSPGYGAGWTTWEGHPEASRYMLEYKPIIEFIESGNKFEREECQGSLRPEEDTILHPLLLQLYEECEEKFGTSIYLGGAYQLEVATVDGPVRVTEYDGYESYETPDSMEWM